jgi:hypothetical protein
MIQSIGPRKMTTPPRSPACYGSFWASFVQPVAIRTLTPEQRPMRVPLQRGCRGGAEVAAGARRAPARISGAPVTCGYSRRALKARVEPVNGAGAD